MLRCNKVLWIVLFLVCLNIFIIFFQTNNTDKRKCVSVGTVDSVGFNCINFNGYTHLAILDTPSSNTYPNRKQNKTQQTCKVTHSDILIRIAKTISPKLIIDLYVVGDEKGRIDNELLYKALAEIYKDDFSNTVINMSFKTVEEPRLNRIIEKLSKNGEILIGAAGNKGENYIEYPASNPNVISIGGIDVTGMKDNCSNYGDIDFVMPVEFKMNKSKVCEGTSISAMLFSILTVGIWDENPNLDKHEVITLLKSYSMNPYNEDVIGYGQPVLKD